MSKAARITEIVGSSTKGWEDAAQNALRAACDTCGDVRGIDVISQTGIVKNGKIIEFRTTVKVAHGVD